MLKGCATFISTYFSTISSKLLCGIFSMFSSAALRYIIGANLKFPFAILTVRILPANSYISEKRKACILDKASKLPALSVERKFVSKSSIARILLMRSSSRASSADSVIPSLFSSAIFSPFASFVPILYHRMALITSRNDKINS